MSADKSAAALAFATMLSEQLMPKVAPESQPEQPLEAPQTPENAPGGEEIPEQGETLDLEETEELNVEEYLTDMEVRMDEKLESFKEEILGAIKSNK